MAVRQFTTWQKLFKEKRKLLISLFTSKEIRNEEWRDVIGYEKKYSVSNLGRVKCKTKHCNYPANRIVNYYISKGYPSVLLFRDNQPKRITVLGLIASAFIGPRP